MIDRDTARSAADELLSAALLGEDWSASLQRLAEAAQAGGATVMRLRGGRPVAGLSSIGWIEADAAMLAGQAPPSPRRFFPDQAFGGGFLGDTDIWPDAELRRDAYFQEFLRPRGVFYHAKARLTAEAGERVSISLKRVSRFGPYEPRDIAVLDSLLPSLRAAVRIERRVLDAEAAGMARALGRGGDPVFELDVRGRVRHAHGESGEHLGIVVRAGRLVATDRLGQPALDRAVAAAVGEMRQPMLVSVADPRGERRFLQVVPVPGRARDVFLATIALVVVIEPARAGAKPLPDAIRQALGLTEREAQIAGLLAAGLSLASIASRLELGLGTARNHLKAIFAKTGARRQGELVALLGALQR